MSGKQIAVGLVILSIAGAVAIALQYIPTGEGNKEISQIEQKDGVIEKETDTSRITAAYPIETPLALSAGAEADARAVLNMESFVNRVIADFNANAGAGASKEELAALGVGEGRKFELGIEYQTFASENFVSYVFTVYEDMLGAHPNGYYHTFVYEQKTGAELSLSDLFVPGSRYLDRISQEAFAQVKTELETRSGGPVKGEALDTVRIGTSPTPETLQFFFIEEGDLVILIPPYQAAAYAAGDFKVNIPLASLFDILKPEYRP